MGVALPRSLSPSAVSAFKDCPLAFKFSYLDRLPEPPSAAASKGTLVHRALELLMIVAAPPTARSTPRSWISSKARVEIAGHPDFTELDLTEAEWAQLLSEAEVLVRRYFELEDPTTVRPIGLELKLEAASSTACVAGHHRPARA